jgi:tetratricopeptide (TPR) repeat protein
MLQKFVRPAFVASLLYTAAGVAGLVPVATAQAADQKSADQKVGKEVGVPLSAAQKAAQAGDWAGALASIKQAQAVANRTPYEDYFINKFLSIVAINLKDMNTARTAAEAALASPAMPPEDKKDLLHNAFILESANNNYPGIIQYGKQLEAVAPMDPEQLTNMAIAYYNTKDTADAQQYAQKAIAAAKAAGKQPPQAALEITMNAQAKNNPEAAVQTLEQIVSQTNSPVEWGKLISVDFGTKGMDDVIAMDLYRLMLVTKAFNASEAKLAGRLANSLHYYGDTVAILESAGVTGADLNAAKNSAAKEQGLIATEISAARKSGGQTALSVAEGLYGYGRYAEAEELARLAGAKARKDPGEAEMVVGMAQVRQGKFAEAAQSLQSVSGNAAMMKTAHLWGIYARQQAGGSAAAAPAATPPH